jgi:hypothetical protein
MRATCLPVSSSLDTVTMPFKGLNRYCKEVKHIGKGFVPSPCCGRVTQHCSARMTAIAGCWRRLVWSHQIAIHRSFPYEARGSVHWFNWFNDAVRWCSVEWPDEQWKMNWKKCGRKLSWPNLKQCSSNRPTGLRKITTAALRAKFWISGFQNKKQKD